MSIITSRKNFFESDEDNSQLRQLEQIIDIRNGMSILEIGCGSGHELKRLCENKAVTALGIDSSSQHITQEDSPDTENIKFIVDNAETFNLTEKFDRILIKLTLHLLTNKRIALQNAFDHLKPNGRLVIVLHSDKSEPKLQTWIAWFMDLYNCHLYYRPELTFERDNKLFDDFEIVSRQLITVSKKITNPDLYLQHLDDLKNKFRPKLVDYQWQSFIDYAERNMKNEIRKRGQFEEISVLGAIIITK